MTIHYRWHPLYGQNVRVLKHVARDADLYVFCELPDATVCALPSWMTDAGACSSHSLGAPMAAASVLAELSALLNVAKPSCGSDKPKATLGSKEVTDETEAGNVQRSTSVADARSQRDVVRRNQSGGRKGTRGAPARSGNGRPAASRGRTR